MRTQFVTIAVAVSAAAAVVAATFGGPAEDSAAARDVRDPAEDTGAAPGRGVRRSGASAGEDREDSGALRLVVPAHEPLLRQAGEHEPPEVPDGSVRAHAYHYVSQVFDRPARRPRAVGFVRRGMVLRAGDRVSGPGCKRGTWYRLAGGQGYVCSRDGFAMSRTPVAPLHRQPPPDVDAALPHRYGKAATTEALRYYRIPDAQERAEIELARQGEGRVPDVVERTLDGVFLLALDREERDGDRAYFRTVRGRYVAVEDVEPKPLPAMRGELLDGKRKLPLAFVYGEGDATLFRRGDGVPVAVGSAEKHARFAVASEQRWGDADMVVRADGVAARRERVRVVRPIARPADVGPTDKWIHVDLDEQALVAYEGDRPVFATLVSSGKGAEFATPTGLYQVREKHISTTMSGPDPDAGYYEVEEVPWTLYYHDSYALHGAYWHDEFGNTRSHGCTNISPVDARWLFYWSDDELPPGWHALRKLRGTWVYLTREREPT